MYPNQRLREYYGVVQNSRLTAVPVAYSYVGVGIYNVHTVPLKSISYHPLARRESLRALRDSCSAGRDSRSARWPKTCKYHGQNS